MTYKPHLRGAFILYVILFLLLPVQTKAQTPVTFDNVTIALWPEYDQPEVLVMYRARLSSDVTLPTQLTFKLPGYVKQMHAVAMSTEEGLINVGDDRVKTSHEGDNLILSFPTSAPNIQFEYYDPNILTQQDQKRELAFNFASPYDIKIVAFEVQQPFEAESFSAIPEPENTITGGDGLKYSTIVRQGLTAGENAQLLATYQRNTDNLSVEALRQDIPQAVVNVPAESEASAGISPNVAYGLIGVGAVLLIAAGGYWLWANSRSSNESVVMRRAPQKRRKAVRRKKEPKSIKKQQAKAFAAEPIAAAFCYKCGAALKDDASFCHACGTKRRV